MTLFYREYGNGSPLLILHGMLGSSGNWHTLSRKVFADDFRVFTIDQRNHGQSPHDAEMNYPVLADDILKFADEHGLDSFNLIGHSMGGKVAMHIATENPELVSRLVVVDIAPKKYGDQLRYIFDALRSLDLSLVSERSEVDAILATSVPSFSVRQFLLKNLALGKDKQYFWKLGLENIWAAFEHIVDDHLDGSFDGPTLFVRGSESDYVDDADMWSIRKHFPNSQLKTIQKAGHWVHSDAPEEFAASVVDFLKDEY